MKKIFVLILAVLVFSLAGCGGTSEPQSLRVAVLPILDALPMHVALDKGYFAEENLNVELVSVNSGPERDQLMQSGQVDAMINEIVSVLFYNQQDTEVVIVRFARTATADSPVFSILAAPDSGILGVEDLAGVEIGISDATVIEYMTDRVLEHEGLSKDEIKTVAVPRIPDRLALLLSGELQAATLPDPVTELAVMQGASVITDDSVLPEVGTSVISFSVDAVKEKPQAVRGFLAALEKAVNDLNTNPEEYTPMLSELGIVPEPLMASFQLPPYVTASVPSIAQWEDAIDWAVGKGLISNAPDYSASVDANFLP